MESVWVDLGVIVLMYIVGGSIGCALGFFLCECNCKPSYFFKRIKTWLSLMASRQING
jgi:hypothetical protein